MAEPLFPDGLVGKSFGDQFGLVVDIAPVDHQRIGHDLSNHRPRRETELFPFGQQHQRIGIDDRFIHIAAIDDGIAAGS